MPALLARVFVVGTLVGGCGAAPDCQVGETEVARLLAEASRLPREIGQEVLEVVAASPVAGSPYSILGLLYFDLTAYGRDSVVTETPGSTAGERTPRSRLVEGWLRTSAASESAPCVLLPANLRGMDLVVDEEHGTLHGSAESLVGGGFVARICFTGLRRDSQWGLERIRPCGRAWGLERGHIGWLFVDGE